MTAIAKQYHQTFLIEGKYFGQSLRGPVAVHGQLQAPASIAAFCPVCAEVWARCPVHSRFGTERFMAYTLACRDHRRDGQAVSGSLLLTWDQDFINSFTREVWSWELDRHLDTIPEGET